MRFLCKGLILLMSITAGLGADKDEAIFKPGPAASYPNHQSVGKLIVAAKVYRTHEQTKAAFGKADPNKYGVLPILLIMDNESGDALSLNRMRVEYIRPDNRPIDPIPASEVQYRAGIKKPNTTGQRLPYPLPGLGGKKKNPLAGFEIEGRAFAAKMLPPGDSAHGFVYFNTAHFRDAILYITGIVKASTGQELFFMEIPLDN